MSYRIHTTYSLALQVTASTPTQINAGLGGYEYDERHDTDLRLVLNDTGNQEALVLVGNRDEMRDFATYLSAIVNDDANWAGPVPCDYNHYDGGAAPILRPADWWVQDGLGQWTPLCGADLSEFWSGSEREGQPFTIVPIATDPGGPKRLKKMSDR